MRYLMLLLACLLPAIGLADDPRPEHYRGEAAPTLEQALQNFTEYNARLAELLALEAPRARDLDAIHQLTYTLENALERIDLELGTLADTLEALHVASEEADYEGVARHGQAYLETARKLRE